MAQNKLRKNSDAITSTDEIPPVNTTNGTLAKRRAAIKALQDALKAKANGSGPPGGNSDGDGDDDGDGGDGDGDDDDGDGDDDGDDDDGDGDDEGDNEEVRKAKKALRAAKKQQKDLERKHTAEAAHFIKNNDTDKEFHCDSESGKGLILKPGTPLTTRKKIHCGVHRMKNTVDRMIGPSVTGGPIKGGARVRITKKKNKRTV